MTSIVSKSALIFSSFSLGLSAIALNPPNVQAATINYNFDVTINFGPLLGNTYNGNFSYDNALIPGAIDLGGFKSIPISDFAFNFEGTNYTEANDSFASVDFVTTNNDFLGLNYAGLDFSFISGAFTLNLDDAIFTYDLGTLGSGTGNIVYNLSTTDIPEAGNIWGLLILGSGIIIKTLTKNKS